MTGARLGRRAADMHDGASQNEDGELLAMIKAARRHAGLDVVARLQKDHRRMAGLGRMVRRTRNRAGTPEAANSTRAGTAPLPATAPERGGLSRLPDGEPY